MQGSLGFGWWGEQSVRSLLGRAGQSTRPRDPQFSPTHFFFFSEKDMFTTQKIPGYFGQPEDPEASPLILSLFLDGDINKQNQDWGRLGSRGSGPEDSTSNAQMARLGVPGPP